MNAAQHHGAGGHKDAGHVKVIFSPLTGLIGSRGGSDPREIAEVQVNLHK